MARPRPEALEQAVKLLSGREKTSAQLEAGLRQRGYGDAEIASALERVRALGYLDDAKVAFRRAVAELQAGWALEGACARLVAAGSFEATARDAVARAAKELEWDEASAAQALVTQRRVRGAKAARLLAARGFSEDVVARFGATGDAAD